MPLQRRIYKSRFFDPREELLFIGEEIRYSSKDCSPPSPFLPKENKTLLTTEPGIKVFF